LAGTRAQLQAIFDNITEGICVLDRDRDIVHMNPACRRLLGLSDTSSSREDAISAFEIVSLNGEIVPDEQWPATRALRGDFVRNLEFYIRQKVSGKTFSVEYNTAPIRDETGEVYQIILSYRDVTERRQSEARYRTLFDYAPDGILIADPQSYYLDANASMCRMLGYTREELVGLHASDIVVQSEVPHIGEALSVIESRADYQREWQFRRKDGSIFAAEVIATMMPDGNLLGMVRDITERKRADATLREAEKEKQLAFEASRLKSEFLANMSHELRTPLNCIIGFTEFLMDERPGPLNPKQKEYLTDVYNSSKHLLQLINDVLDLAKVEAGKTELYLEAFLLAKAIEEVCAVVKGIAQKKGVNLQWTVDPELGLVTLDQQKFKQVCYNLLSNAVKFTDARGSVNIDALARESGQFEVRVKDTGIGIKKEDLPRLFREFEQLESGSDRRFEGTGLGLALTKKLVESHGGSIGVESEYGSGSTFFAIMPTIVRKEKS
jgi:PAS domain S-box-containing protein